MHCGHRFSPWLVVVGLACNPWSSEPLAAPGGNAGTSGTSSGETPGNVAIDSDGGPSSVGSRPIPDLSIGAPIDFEHDVQPIFADHCVTCHGGVRQLGNPPMSLQARETSAFALGSGDPEQSLLYLRVTSADPRTRMPLGGAPLTADQIVKLRHWLAEGAPWPTHWAFRPPNRVDPAAVPVSNEAWVRTPIDRFILAKLDQMGLAPSPEADAVTLIRRLSLDLTGIPPAPADVAAFAADPSPTAYEQLVDRLLGSLAFGERWGRHWLDQARYADSDGYQIDYIRGSAWRWRDWVIDAFNADMAFDQFTIQQIAGDLMPGAAPLTVLGTGFHNQTLFNREPGVVAEEDRTRRTIDRAATVANVWLGLTLQCADCHSHPYDRVSQKEFYQLYAFFNNFDETTATVPATSRIDESAVTQAEVMQERGQDRRQTFLLIRGQYLQPDMTTGPLTPAPPSILHPFRPRGATPDRLDLANWLIDPANPVTARITVNTIWYHLFGRGIVSSLMDFGNRASFPSHPELLDWLATDFVEKGWKRKRAIKQIVMSATYRQSSVLYADAMASDPENVWLARQNRMRLEAEAIVDEHLSVSGLLSSKVGGPAVFPPIEPEVAPMVAGAYDNFQWVESRGDDAFRRGIYTFHKRIMSYPDLAVFDWPAATESVNGRSNSDTALQALTTLHAAQFVAAAQSFARRIQADTAGAALREQLTYAWRLALARLPSDDELAELEALYGDSRQFYASHTDRIADALGAFAPTGVPGEDAAAWVATARTILNTDEFITRE